LRQGQKGYVKMNAGERFRNGEEEAVLREDVAKKGPILKGKQQQRDAERDGEEGSQPRP